MKTFINILIIIAPVVYVLYLILRPKQTVVANEIDDRTKVLRENLRANAKKFEINFDNCKFKNSSYISEVEQNNSDYQMAASAIGASPIYYTPVEKVETVQSVLFYSDKNVADGKRFYQTFPIEETTLKYHVINGNVFLYIDKNDNDKYFFEVIPG